MQIPFLSLKDLNKPYKEEFQEIFNDFIERGYFMLSDNIRTFEEEFATYCSANFCIGVANGLDALELIIESLDFARGSEIIVPANTYYASILSILNTNLTPVLVEPNINTYLIEPNSISAFVSEKTVAILAVNLYGKMCDFEGLRNVANELNLKIIVDAAQSHGALQNNSKDCFGADAIAYSFYPTKNLGALSDAGAVVTNSEELARKIKARRNYGSEIKYQFDYLGRNSRLSELQAGFLSLKLKHLDKELSKRREIASRYLKEIVNPKVILPSSDTIQEDAWHLFVIRCKERELFTKYLKENGVGFDIHYPIPPHKQKALELYKHLSLPVTEEIHNTVVSLPLNPTLTTEQIDYIITTINNF